MVGNNVLGVLGAEADIELENIMGEDTVGPKFGVILPAGNRGFKLGLVNDDIEEVLREFLALLRVETAVPPFAAVIGPALVSLRLVCLVVVGEITAVVAGVEGGTAVVVRWA